MLLRTATSRDTTKRTQTAATKQCASQAAPHTRTRAVYQQPAGSSSQQRAHAVQQQKHIVRPQLYGVCVVCVCVCGVCHVLFVMCVKPPRLPSLSPLSHHGVLLQEKKITL